MQKNIYWLEILCDAAQSVKSDLYLILRIIIQTYWHH